MILHLMMDEKFTNDFVFFTNKEFDPQEHRFIVMASQKSPRYTAKLIGIENVIFVNKNVKGLLKLIKMMKRADKIILHGMFIKHIVTLLNLYRLGGKTYWCMWGGDLYDYKKESPRTLKSKTKLISRLKGVVSVLEGDYELAQRVYKAKCPAFGCIYPASTVYEKGAVSAERGTDGPINILLGNSADNENNHAEALQLIKPLKDSNIHIYMPLSYGDREYAHAVAEAAERDFGDKVTPMFEFMEKSAYHKFLATIDVAVFAHKRQQAFSTIVQLMSTGKKIYMYKDGSIVRYMKGIGCEVYDLENIGDTLLEPMSIEQKRANIENVYANMNYEALTAGWKALYEDK